MRIAVTGAHQVGKTTFIQILEDRLDGYQIFQEPYYILEEQGVLFSEEPTVDDFLLQLEYSIKLMEERYHNVIFDRSPLDFLAYLQSLGGEYHVTNHYEKVMDCMSSIDLLIFIRIGDPDIMDSGAADFPALRYQVDALLGEWVHDFDGEVVELSMPFQAADEKILSFLNNVNK